MMALKSIKTLTSRLSGLFNWKQPKLSYVCYKYFSLSSITRQTEVTAGVLIIGDEILNGQAEDKNTSFLIKNLNSSGIKINKIAIVSDDVDAIAEEISYLSRTCTVVLTSGGIGPTHDDVTYEAVAKAIGDQLIQNVELCNLFKDYFGSQANHNPAVLKFSSIPKSAVLNFNTSIHGSAFKFPLVSVKNIFMFPGVPMLLRKEFEVFRSKFIHYNKPKFTETIFISLDEFTVTPILNRTVKYFEGRVKFGSYPSFTDNYYKVKITLESIDKNAINEAREFFTKQLPTEKIVALNENVFESVVNDVSSLCKENASFSLAASIVEQALKTYDLSEICICFNGGKDCTALLHLLYYCVKKLKPDEWSKVKTFYVRNGETFKEVEDFIENSIKNYNLNFYTVEGDLRNEFHKFLQEHPQIKAVFMGTRRCDPGAEMLRYFNPTDDQWPPVMRILPILDYSYSNVWDFIRKLQVPYCVLYDRGYTSLGLKGKTVQNPALLVSDQTKFRSYKPAYMLYNSNEERNSRL